MITKIEWATDTWNPVTGCDPISVGCLHCYARRMANGRLKGRFGYPLNDPFKVTLHEDKLDEPLLWGSRRRRFVFVCSMGDLFHDDVPDKWIDRVMVRAALRPDDVFVLLTKRAGRMREYFNTPDRAGMVFDQFIEEGLDRAGSCDWEPAGPWPYSNIWLGVTAENQAAADERIPLLLATPAAVRFVSVEPCLSGIDLEQNIGGTRWIGGQRGCDGMHQHHCLHEDGTAGDMPHHHHDDRCGPGLDWVLCGAETGAGARPMDLDWARSLRDQCGEAGVRFFFKKAGPKRKAQRHRGTEAQSWEEAAIPEDLMVRQWPGVIQSEE